MTYELAKQLKDAGFPQDKCSQVYKGCSVGISTQSPLMIPTLEELIKACGDGFRMLEKHPRTGKWITHKSHDIEVWSMQAGNEIQYDAPEEAVAKLWLALNAKAD